MGKLYVIGIGPGGLEHMTLKAKQAIEESNIVVGYNKYIDMINMYNIKNAQEVHNNEIDLLKQRLDKFEAYYAKIEASIHRCTKERIAAEEQYAIIEQMSYVA